MSDIRKKIFSIDPTPEEGPLAHVPSEPETETETAPMPDDMSDIDDDDIQPDVATDPDIPALRGRIETPEPPEFRPIVELIRTPVELEINAAKRTTEPRRDRRSDAPRRDPFELPRSGSSSESEAPRRPIIERISSPVELQDEPATLVSPILPGDLRPAGSSPSTASLSATPPARVERAIPPPPRDAILDMRSATSIPGWTGPVLACLTLASVGALVAAYVTQVDSITPFGMAALVLAVLLPTIAVLALWSILRGLSQTHGQANRLAQAATRLTTPDRSVAKDVATLAATIEIKLSAVDTRLTQSGAALEAFSDTVAQQNQLLETASRNLDERSEDIAKRTSAQREDFESLASELQQQIEALTQSFHHRREDLKEASTRAAGEIDRAVSTLAQAARQAADTSATIGQSVASATTELKSVDDRMTQLLAALETRLADVSSVAQDLSDAEDNAGERIGNRVDALTALVSQIDTVERQLDAIIDKSGDLQDSVERQVSASEDALSRLKSGSDDWLAGLDAHLEARLDESVAKISDRLTDLQTRLDQLAAPVETDIAKPKPDRLDAQLPTPEHAEPPILTLSALDIEASDEIDLVIPDEPMDGPFAPSSVPDMTATIPSVGPVPTFEVNSDVVRRPGADMSPKRSFGRARPEEDKAGWRWRDMLGGIDASDVDPPAPSSTSSSASISARPRTDTGIQRPPAGVPLTPPPPLPVAPDGTDIVGRLREVMLDPSNVVDDGTIGAVVEAHQSGGEARFVDIVMSRLNGSVLHLRGVLAADPAFRGRAETFCRDFDLYLGPVFNGETLRAEAQTPSGRAYLLLATALSVS